MADWLYNGVALPALPDYDTAVYPRAVIVRLVDGEGNVSDRASLYVVGGSTAVTYNSGAIYLSHTKRITYTSGSSWMELGSSEHDSAVLLVLDRPGGVNDYGVATGAVTVWTNFNIYNANGSLYLAASEPVPAPEKFDIKKWLLGLLLRLTVKPMPNDRSKTPLGYSYNGTVLPALPEWDRAVYPYALISYRSGIGLYYFSAYESIGYFTSTARHYFGNQAGSSAALVFSCGYAQTEWVRMDRSDWSIPVDHEGGDSAIWTNFDLFDSDETLYIAASEPIPIYE